MLFDLVSLELQDQFIYANCSSQVQIPIVSVRTKYCLFTVFYVHIHKRFESFVLYMWFGATLILILISFFKSNIFLCFFSVFYREKYSKQAVSF